MTAEIPVRKSIPHRDFYVVRKSIPHRDFYVVRRDFGIVINI